MIQEHQFVYEQCISRISDLNKSLFSYRLLLVTIVAAYFTSLSFIAGLSPSLDAPFAINAYFIVFFALTIAALTGVTIVAFFDYIYQELVEHCIDALAKIERSSKLNREVYVFNREGRAAISLWINLAIVFMYLIPLLLLVTISVWISLVMANSAATLDARNALASVICKSIIFDNTVPNLFPQWGGLDCLLPNPTYNFSQEIQKLGISGFLITAFFSGIFSIFFVSSRICSNVAISVWSEMVR